MKKSKTFGKDPRRMAKSIIENLTQNATAPEFEYLVRPTIDVGQTGAGDVLATSDTKDLIGPNSICKYINIRMDVANQSGTGDAGWYEYAIVLMDEQSSQPAVGTTYSNIITQTLAEIAIHRNRGKCLWNGSIPINDGQAKTLDLSIKIPNKWCKWKNGQYLLLIHYYRGADVTGSDILQVNWTAQWKCYL